MNRLDTSLHWPCKTLWNSKTEFWLTTPLQHSSYTIFCKTSRSFTVDLPIHTYTSKTRRNPELCPTTRIPGIQFKRWVTFCCDSPRNTTAWIYLFSKRPQRLRRATARLAAKRTERPSVFTWRQVRSALCMRRRHVTTSATLLKQMIGAKPGNTEVTITF